jgi:hypothetical protein
MGGGSIPPAPCTSGRLQPDNRHKLLSVYRIAYWRRSDRSSGLEKPERLARSRIDCDQGRQRLWRQTRCHRRCAARPRQKSREQSGSKAGLPVGSSHPCRSLSGIPRCLEATLVKIDRTSASGPLHRLRNLPHSVCFADGLNGHPVMAYDMRSTHGVTDQSRLRTIITGRDEQGARSLPTP